MAMTPQPEYVAQFYRMIRSGGLPNIVYANRVVELLQHSLAPAYNRVWKNLWNDSQVSGMKQVYSFTDYESVYEFHIPVTLDPEGFMHYWRIVVKIVEEVSPELIKHEQPNLEWAWVKPAGVIDSETIFYVAQRTERKGVMVRGFRHKKRGFTYVIVDREPESAVKRVKCAIINCLYKRYTALLRKLNLYHSGEKHLDISLKEWLDENRRGLVKRIMNFSLNIMREKLVPYCLVIRRMAECFLESIRYLYDMLKLVEEEIQCRRLLKTAFKPLFYQIKETVSLFTKPNPMRSVEAPSFVKSLAKVVCVEAG